MKKSYTTTVLDELKLTAFRLGATDMAILDALRDKFGLRSRTEALRYAMRRTAEAEGVNVAQSKTKPKRRKIAA